MKSIRFGGCVVAALCLLGTAGGCANRMHDENMDLHRQNRELQARLDAESASETTETVDVTPRQMEPVTPPPAPPVTQPTITRTPPPIQIEGTETTQDPAAGTMTVRVPGDVLFDPGQATVRTGARGTLDKVAAALKKDYAGKQVRIEGHTDSDPIRVSKWKSNQELSEARATAVRQYLVQKGVDGNSIAVHGFGADRPKNKTDKAQNRRVEIVVVTR